jgi:hypothetical protein
VLGEARQSQPVDLTRKVIQTAHTACSTLRAAIAWSVRRRRRSKVSRGKPYSLQNSATGCAGRARARAQVMTAQAIAWASAIARLEEARRPLQDLRGVG